MSGMSSLVKPLRMAYKGVILNSLHQSVMNLLSEQLRENRNEAGRTGNVWRVCQAVLHDGIRFREIKIPEFHNDISCLFRDSKGIGK